MKIQHWAIIFIIIILPISIISRNVISKKNLLLRDETRYNNVIDNATYDAVSQILEISEELGYGADIPMTEAVLDAAIDRFFNTLCVNFNLPFNRENAEAYFCQYIPAIVIVGYDGLYVYSYDSTASGYDFKLKPKIPYAYEYAPNPAKPKQTVTVNFTLDNYAKIYFSGDSFLVGAPDNNGNIDAYGTHILEGYVGEPLDVDQNGVDDLNDYYDINNSWLLIECTSGDEYEYTDNNDPYGIYIDEHDEAWKREAYIKNQVTMYTDNLSYILKEWAKCGVGGNDNIAEYMDIFYEDGANQDYKYDDEGKVLLNASNFHTLRRETIINLITSVLKQEFNEHNYYTDMMGVTYNFNLPDIGREQWNNTIDDISVLSFFQGMPVGVDMYYNNYSLGGSRIVQANYYYGETVLDDSGNEHNVYHKHYCPLIPRDDNENIIYSGGFEDPDNDGYFDYKPFEGVIRKTSGIKDIFVSSLHANKELAPEEDGIRYYICSECM